MMMTPVESMPMKASGAVSTTRRARDSLSARRATAPRRSSSASAATIRCAMAMAKCCSSSVQRRGLMCSAQNTPTVTPFWRSGTSSIEWMPFGTRYDSTNSLVRGSLRASPASMTRSESSASK
jgi:hypothetical protein